MSPLKLGLGIKDMFLEPWSLLLISAPKSLAPLVNARGLAGFKPLLPNPRGLIGGAGDISMGSQSDNRDMFSRGGEFRDTLEANEISRSEEISMSPFRNRLVLFLLREGIDGAARNWLWLVVIEDGAKRDMLSGRERLCHLPDLPLCNVDFPANRPRGGIFSLMEFDCKDCRR